ncbi:MAG: hypothetical protein LBU83_07770, partial [Bacteroidales bacterium]|nr:hypothetical protein [Bacteroidales bacterium]
MKRIFISFIAIFLFGIVSIGAQTTTGTEFWLTFGQMASISHNIVDFQIRIVTGNQPTTVKIELTELGTSHSFTIGAQQIYAYNLDPSERQAVYNTTMGVSNKSIHVTADHPVSVYSMGQRFAVLDATNVLPVTTLSDDYYHISYRAYNMNRHDAYAVIATENNTDIYHDGVWEATLHKGQVYYRTAPSYTEMTGVHITTNHPVAYFTLHACSQIPYSYSTDNFLMQQLAPVNTWGRNFFVPVSFPNKDRVRIVVSENGTTIKQFGGEIKSAQGSQMSLDNLQAGQFVELEVNLNNNGCYIQSDKPVGVCSYLTARQYNDLGLDGPTQAWIPSIEQTTPEALIAPFFPFDPNYVGIHYALVITPTGTKNDTRVSIGGLPPVALSGGSWIENTTADMSFYSMPLTNETASYRFTNEKGLIVMCYAAGNYELHCDVMCGSYYYLAGSAMRDLSAAFLANNIPYNVMYDNVFCEEEITFVANIEGLHPDPGSLTWLIDGEEYEPARDELEWSKPFDAGNYKIEMVVIFEDNSTETYEGMLNVENCNPPCDDPTTTEGTEFWLTFGKALSFGTNVLPSMNMPIRIVAGNKLTSVTLEFTHLGASETVTFPVNPYEVYTYSLNTTQKEALYNTTMGISDYSVYITTTEPVSVYTYINGGGYDDATNVLPVTALGTEYYQISYTNKHTALLDAYAIVATEDDTKIYHNGALVTPTPLNAGQVYYRTSSTDMTGAHITTNDKPVAFFACHQGTTIPFNTSSTNSQLMQQIAPVNTWDKTFFVPVTIMEQGIVRIVVSQDNTNITQITGGVIQTDVPGAKTTLTNLQAGDFVELDITSNGCFIKADKPVGVCSYMKLCMTPGYLSISAQAWIPGIQQTVSNAFVSSFMSYGVFSEHVAHFVLILTPTDTRDNTTVSIGGGTPGALSGGSWIENTEAGLSFYSMPLDNENASCHFSNPEGLIIWGYGVGIYPLYRSYYYLAGSAMHNLSAAFTANGISYEVMSDHVFCEEEITFVAEIDETCNQAESIDWYIDGVHQTGLTGLLTWAETFSIGNHTVKLVVVFDDGTTKEYEGNFKISNCLEPECLDLYATGISSDGFLELEWEWLPPPPTGVYGFTLYQWDETLGDWQTVSLNCDKEIQVLNVYPNIGNNLQDWMSDPEIGLGKINVTPVSINDFNANPDFYLKSGGEYIYDAIMFGSWDSFNFTDLITPSAIAVRAFLDSGRGVLFGHDTQYSAHPGFSSLTDKTNLYLNNSAGMGSGSNIKVVNNGFLLKYPHLIPYESVLSIPQAHVTYQFACGIVWMKFCDPLGGTLFPEIIMNGGTNNFYLTTWNNAAFIQTGHSMGASTLDERKVIANTLWYLAQFTTETIATVCSAFDITAPDTPTVTRHDCNLVDIVSKDNGNPYHFYVMATNVANYADTCKSNILDIVNTSGLVGFYILEDSNPNGVPEASNPFTVFIAATDNQTVTYTIQDLTKYVHIQAVDIAGNLSEVYTLEPEDCWEPCEGLELYSTDISTEGCIELEWTWLPPPPTGSYGFTLYQWDDVLGIWQTASTNYDKEIQVLNVFPDVGNNLQAWMSDPTIGLGKIIVTPVSITNFNANPDLYLKSGGEYIYDAIMFGSWDSNNSKDLTSASATAVRAFLDSGRGVIFGHDTQRLTFPNFASLADKTNLYLDPFVSLERGSENIKVINDGFLLKYPHIIPYNSILTIPLTHSGQRQFAKGIVWMNFPDPLVNPGSFTAPATMQNGGTNDFYLTTWNNAAMIQTGHSSGQSTLDERKVIANALWYVAQFTTDTTAKVCSALDLAAPDAPTATRHDCNLVDIVSKDNGSLYQFYVKATNTTNYADTCKSNILEVENKSGLMGFYILEDNDPNGIP